MTGFRDMVSGTQSYAGVSDFEAVCGKGAKGAEFVSNLTTKIGACAAMPSHVASIETSAPSTGRGGRS